MPSLGWKKPPKQAQEQSRVRAEAKGWEVGPGPRVAADEEAGLSGAHSLCGGRGQRAEGRGQGAEQHTGVCVGCLDWLK